MSENSIRRIYVYPLSCYRIASLFCQSPIGVLESAESCLYSMVESEGLKTRAIIRMSELARMKSTGDVWNQIIKWDPYVSVEGLKPHLSAYRRFVCEPQSNGLLHTDRYLDRSRYHHGYPLAIHVVGPTDVGKNSVLEEMSVPWVLSDTERPQREEEVQDKTYHFVTRTQMDKSIQHGDLVEYTRNLYKDGNFYRYGTHSARVLQMIDSREPVFAILINQDGIKPISRFLGEHCIPIMRIFILPNSRASDYFERVKKERGDARISTAQAEIEFTPDLYPIDVILGNPYDPETRRPILAASALGTWLTRTFDVRLPEPKDGVIYS